MSENGRHTANEERLIDESAKRHRTDEYWQKRYEQNELETKEALERKKFLIKMDALKRVVRQHQLEQEEFTHFADLGVHDKSNELYLRAIYRTVIMKWRKHAIQANEERINKAIAFHNRNCMKMALDRWIEPYLTTRNNTRKSNKIFC